MINKITMTFFCVLTIFSTAFSSDGCFDDVTGAFTSATNPVTSSSLGLSCDEVVNSMQILCTADSFTYSNITIDIGQLVSTECPLSCNTCAAHFSAPDNNFQPMNIFITSADIVGVDLDEGDEIGVFDGGTCVAMAVVRQTITLNQDGMLSIIVPTDDTDTAEKDGFTTGNAISFRYWDASANTEYAWITAAYLSGSDQVFTSQGTSFASLSLANLSSDNGVYPTTFSIHNAYPNPFNPTINIAYGILENSNVQIDIFDITGKKIHSLLNEFQTSGYHTIEWNASSNSSGIYFITLQSDHLKETKKITYLK